MENIDNRQNDNEIIIENKYIVTEELFKSWTKDNVIVKRFKIFWIAMSILFIILSILCIVVNRSGDAIYLALVGLYCVYRGLFRNSLVAEKRYKMLVDLYKKIDWERRIVFYNDYFETIDGFNFQEVANQSFGTYLNEPMNVKLRFSGKAVEDVKNYFFHPTQKITDNGSNVIVEFRASGDEAICWELFKWGEFVEILAPQKLHDIYYNKLSDIIRVMTSD